MIADTIIVVLVGIMPAQQPREVKQNRFKEVFEQADKDFEKKHILDIEELKRASNDAVKSADIKSKAERDRVMRPLFDVYELFKKKNP